MRNYLANYHKIIRLAIVVTVGFFLTQCEHGDKLNSPNPTTALPFTVSSDYALKIASAFNQYPDNKKARIAADGQENTSRDSLIIDKTESYNKDGKTIFHVINYKNNKGWMIVSADRRVTPILAYSHTGKFDLRNLGDGTGAWVEGVASLSHKAQSEKSSPTKMIEARWKYYERNMKIGDSNGRVAYDCSGGWSPYNPQCPDGNIYANQGYPATLAGTWGSAWQQRYGYSYSLSDVDQTVPACSYCGNKSLTGCGPLAASMVLLANNRNKMVNKPIGYNFDLMTNLIQGISCNNMSPGEIELSKLIHFSFVTANAQYIPFSCSVPTAPGNIPNVFAVAGYSNSGSMQDFYSAQGALKGDLHAGYPVVMSGMTCGTCLSTWHIWVIDGFHQDTFYNLDCSGSTPYCAESAFLFYSIKWGHGNSQGADGWYGFTNFVENGDLYNTNLKVNVGARP